MTNGQPRAIFRVLFVCTGNVCRSPTAEGLLRRRIADGGAGGALTVASAGVGTENGWRMDPSIVELLEKRGLRGMSDFRSRVLTDAILATADLVLTGTREHRLHIGKTWPETYARTFTLRECAWLLTGMPPHIRAGLPESDGRPRAVVHWLQDERGLASIPAGEFDIEDPIGRRPGIYRRMVDEVAAAVDVLAHALLPSGVPALPTGC